MVYTFQVQKDKSKFLGLNGTKLDIIVRLHLLVFLNQITFFYSVCKKISFFLLTGFSVEKSGYILKCWKGEVACGYPKDTPSVRKKRPIVYMIRSYLFRRSMIHILDMFLLLWILNLNNFSKNTICQTSYLWVPLFYGKLLLQFSR